MRLLLVALDDVRRARRGGVRVEARLAERLALAQEVPTLVERDLQLLQALPVALAGRSLALALPQIVLLGDEPFDARVDLGIVHRFSFQAATSNATSST